MSLLGHNGEEFDAKETEKLNEFADPEREGVVRNHELIDKLMLGRTRRIKVGKQFIS
jgi:hypothetical protein